MGVVMKPEPGEAMWQVFSVQPGCPPCCRLTRWADLLPSEKAAWAVAEAAARRGPAATITHDLAVSLLRDKYMDVPGYGFARIERRRRDVILNLGNDHIEAHRNAYRAAQVLLMLVGRKRAQFDAFFGRWAAP